MIDRVRLSKTMAHALRHAPWLYELELDEQGWVPVEQLLNRLRSHRTAWADLSLSDIEAVIDAPGKKRYDLREGYIRAYYGHSKGVAHIAKTPAAPPAVLYHGTAQGVVDLIKKKGLQPMNRQYVHLSADRATAQQVGSRKGDVVIILTIDAQRAHRDGVTFYLGNQKVWLADTIPPEYIGFPSVGEA